MQSGESPVRVVTHDLLAISRKALRIFYDEIVDETGVVIGHLLEHILQVVPRIVPHFVHRGWRHDISLAGRLIDIRESSRGALDAAAWIDCIRPRRKKTA